MEHYRGVHIDFCEAQWGGLQKTDRALKPHACSFVDGSVEHHEWAFFAIGVSELVGGAFAGPDFTPVHAVELYVSSSDLNAPWLDDENASDTFCEHGQDKKLGSCKRCKHPLAGCLTCDHSPYTPCLPGHGAQWLWDCGERGAGRKTLDSTAFFHALAEAEVRAFKRSKWPQLYTGDFEQTACSGYHNICLGDDVLFSGWLANGLPDKLSSVRWRDGTEYHGEFVDGVMAGYGRFIFPEGGWEFRGTFARGLPQTGMLLPPRGQCRRFVECSKHVPIWEIQPEQLVLEDMVEVPTPPFVWARADCLALVHVVTSSDGTKTHNFHHLKRVTARLVWARPMHADMPLWNASECRGKIVAIMRGPRKPAPSCSFSIKGLPLSVSLAPGVSVCEPRGRGRARNPLPSITELRNASELSCAQVPLRVCVLCLVLYVCIVCALSAYRASCMYCVCFVYVLCVLRVLQCFEWR